MAGDSHAEIPESGAVFTFGRSRFANNAASHFFIRNDPVVEISCGDEHTAVVCQNGRVFAFGNNSWGQLGLGHKNTATMPSCVKSLKPEKATHIACGKSHTIVSTSSGKVFSFGCNMDCQLGLGDSEERSVPTEVQGIRAGEGGVRMLAAGCQHSAALTVEGKLFVWGNNADGQLGLGESVTLADKPRLLDIPHAISHVSCGYYHTALVTEEGKLLMCGEGENGKLGLSRDNGSVFAPTAVNVNVPIRFATCGGNHTIAVTMDGDVFGFGSNLSGQLGLGREVLMYSVPEGVEALLGKHVCAAACGESHTAFLTVEGHMYVCGDGRHGKLCVETDEVDGAVLCLPQFVSRFCHYRVKQVACGGCHTMVQAVLQVEEAKELANGVVNGDVSLRLEASAPQATDEESPPKETIGRTLPPLQTPVLQESGSNDVKPIIENGHLSPTHEKKEESPPVTSEPCLDETPSDLKTIHNGYIEKQPDTNIIENLSTDDAPIDTEKEKLITLEDDMLSNCNLRDAGELAKEFETSTNEQNENPSNLSETSDTLKIKDDDEREKDKAGSEDQNAPPILTVTGANEKDVPGDENVLGTDETKPIPKKKSAASLELRAEGRIAKFLNAFRRKKLSEENVSVNMNPAWAGVERRISNESSIVNGKNSSKNKLRPGRITESKACIIL